MNDSIHQLGMSQVFGFTA